MSALTGQRSRLLFTFAEGDLGVVRTLAEQVRLENGDVQIDLSMTSEPFAAPQSEYIRASLAVRVRRSAATVCPFGPETFADDWVLWTLEAARSFGRPIIGCPLTAVPAQEAIDLFASLGALLVPARPAVLIRCLAEIDGEHGGRAPAEEASPHDLLEKVNPLRRQAARPAPAAQ